MRGAKLVVDVPLVNSLTLVYPLPSTLGVHRDIITIPFLEVRSLVHLLSRLANERSVKFLLAPLPTMALVEIKA